MSVCPGQWGRGQTEGGWDQQAVILLLSNVLIPMICFKSKGPGAISSGQYLIHITAPASKSQDFQVQMRTSREEEFSQVVKEQK